MTTTSPKISRTTRVFAAFILRSGETRKFEMAVGVQFILEVLGTSVGV